jgi:hypothetical protein
MRERVRKILRFKGYDVVRLNQFGAQTVSDIAALFQGRSLRTIFDVGANWGQTTLEYLKHFPGGYHLQL